MSTTHTNDEDLITAINITPLVDIFLVLLIIFMITSTIVTQQHIPLDIPRAAHAGSKAPEAVGFVIDKDGKFYLDGIVMDSASIFDYLQRSSGENADFQVLVAADRELSYQKVIDALDLVRAAGVNKYALKVVRR